MTYQCYSSRLHRITLLLATVFVASLVATDPQDASSLSAGGRSDAQPQAQLPADDASNLLRQQKQQVAQTSNQQGSPAGVAPPSSNLEQIQSSGIKQSFLKSQILDSDDGRSLVHPRAMAPKFLGKKANSGPITLEERGSPLFLGKKSDDRTEFKSADGEDIFLARRGSPLFLGKKNKHNTLGLRNRVKAILLANRGSPRFVGKRGNEDISLSNRGAPKFFGKRGNGALRDEEEDEDRGHYFGFQIRGSPMFLGKKKSDEEADEFAVNSRFVGEGMDTGRDLRATSPKFLGKRQWAGTGDAVSASGNEQLSTGNEKHKIVKRKAEVVAASSGIDSTSFGHIDKRHAPKFVGKRLYQYSQRGAPFFIGKRPIRIPSGSSSPFLSEQEYKETFRRSDPFFIGKRGFDVDFEDATLNDAILSAFRRGAPKFVGKRGSPKFVGRRGAPKFVGRRGSPYFVGKKDLSFNDGFSWEMDNFPWIDEDEGLKRGSPKFVGRRSEFFDDGNGYLKSHDMSERDYGELLEALSRYEAVQSVRARLQERKRTEGPEIFGRRSTHEFPSSLFSSGSVDIKRR